MKVVHVHNGVRREIELAERSPGLGDAVAAIATPIARALRLPCIDPQTQQLKPESGCGKAKARLNAGEPIIPTIIKRMKGI